MSWTKRAQNGGDISERVKDRIRSDPFFLALFKHFKIPIARLDTNLTIHLKRLEKSFCEANDEEIIIDDRLAKSPNFLSSDFHFVAHEMLHWLRRQKEQMSYFADPEEVESFSVAIAYSLDRMRGQPGWEHAIEKTFLPLIQINIPDDTQSRAFLKDRITEAKKLLAQIGQ